MNDFVLTPIGRVSSALTDPGSAPRQPDEGAPEAWLVLDPAFAAGLEGLKAGDEIILLTWLDRARRDLLAIRPRGDMSRPAQGVFGTRAPHRPNPVGLHQTRIAAIDGNRVKVTGLEALDGTPILDIKPVLPVEIAER